MKKNKDNFKELITPTISNIDWTIDNLMMRGYDDVSQDIDDYSELISKYEFRKLIVFELYENYFLPERHEFELQILNEIVEAVQKYQPWSYLAGAAISGVVGNSVYDLLKKLLSHVSSKFKNKDDKRSKIFNNIKTDISNIEKYFEKHKSADIVELEKHLNIDRDKLLPLLKLLGFKCRRRKNKKLWMKST